LLAQQIKEPAEERRIAADIPVLTTIEGEVSRAVRQQYEESPYPRWVHAGPPGQPIILNDRRPDQPFDALVAGCGTGLSTVEFARQTPHARVLAIDLSLASLCYAQRMARSYGLTNVEFGQADIAKLAVIGRDFDYVDASGVLHHLADPWEGWRILLSLLRPGGVMLVGLYSELARQSIVAARSLIADRGYRPIPEDIRRCREDVIAAEDGSLLKSVIHWNDFFAMSECRDLLFHVQEHHVTLREIKLFLAATGMQFGGFVLDAPTFQRFATHFPEPAAVTNLDCWQDFESQAPSTFTAMYQFWVHKPPPTTKPD
jgi:SAM-dependent methyltransferase